jgi:hypothetical protein
MHANVFSVKLVASFLYPVTSWRKRLNLLPVLVMNIKILPKLNKKTLLKARERERESK